MEKLFRLIVENFILLSLIQKEIWAIIDWLDIRFDFEWSKIMTSIFTIFFFIRKHGLDLQCSIILITSTYMFFEQVNVFIYVPTQKQLIIESINTHSTGKPKVSLRKFIAALFYYIMGRNFKCNLRKLSWVSYNETCSNPLVN